MRVEGRAGSSPAARPPVDVPARPPAGRGDPRPRPADAPAPAPAAAPPAEASRPALDTSRMRAELSSLADALAGADADRRDRARAWLIRGELRKLEALDGFLSGFVRG